MSNIKGMFCKPGPWYYLNPDYRRDAPETGLFCCRCQKKIEKSYIAVEVNWETMEVRNNPLGKELIGNDCWKKVQIDE